MKLSYRNLAIATLALILFSAVPAVVNAQCVSGTSTATFQTTGPFAGLWKYTLEITWSTTQGLSNVTMDCGFGDCPTLACAATYMFDTPAGQSTGEGGCTADYDGEFNCDGNPSIGVTDPIIKWDAVGSCEPENTGSGTFCFYTNLGPNPNSSESLFLIKNGQQVCQGTISGDCPLACVVPTEPTSLGKVKAKY